MRLALALGLSAAVHAAVALSLWKAEEPPTAAVVAPVKATKVALFDVVQSPAPLAARAAGKSAPRQRARPDAPQPQLPSEEAEGEREVAAPTATADSAPASPGPAAEGAASPPARSLDLAALHAALAESARRCYPAAARRWNLTGEATVAFCLDTAGALTSSKLAASSGQAMLDAAASGCVITGALPLPKEASGGCYSVPVRFAR